MIDVPPLLIENRSVVTGGWQWRHTSPNGKTVAGWCPTLDAVKPACLWAVWGDPDSYKHEVRLVPWKSPPPLAACSIHGLDVCSCFEGGRA